MANPPRTHTGYVTTLAGDAGTGAYLPRDWHAGTPVAVIDLTALPPGLTPNLNGDGTYWGEQRHVPAGWQVQITARGNWAITKHDPESRVIVQARPAPRPPTERIPWHQTVGRKLPDGTDIYSVTKAEDELYIMTGAPNKGYEQTDLNPDGMVEVLVDGDDWCSCDDPTKELTEPTHRVSEHTTVDRPGGGDR